MRHEVSDVMGVVKEDLESDGGKKDGPVKC